MVKNIAKCVSYPWTLGLLPVGETRTIHVDCRFIAATNRDLLEEIDEGRFREDLYYRLNVLPIDLPPLRDRSEDVPLLVHFFLQRLAEINGVEFPQIPNETLSLLKAYPWPGNVRELQNYVERALLLSTTGSITPDLLPDHVRGLSPPRARRRGRGDLASLCEELVEDGIQRAGNEATNLHERIVSLVERELIAQVLRRCQGVQTKAATRLGINRNTLHKKIDDYDLQSEAR
jgi:DNA-binding NtrC family response regulator